MEHDHCSCMMLIRKHTLHYRSKDQSGNLVLPLCKAGFTVALIGYDLAPQVTLTQIVDECCKGVALIALRHPHAQLVIGGHSCGAHLAASLMYAKWGEYGLRECPLKGMYMHLVHGLGLCVSLFELTC